MKSANDSLQTNSQVYKYRKKPIDIYLALLYIHHLIIN